MKYLNWRSRLIILIFPILIILLYANLNTFAEEKPITLLPDSRLFSLENMAPGDINSATITIQNTTEELMNYDVSSSLQSGSKLFYDHLQLQVLDQDTILYDGLLSQLKMKALRELKKNSSETLTFKILFPITSKNEFQGLKSVVAFHFTGNGDELNEPPSDGDNPPTKDTGSLPQTGEENPLFIILSGLFISISGLALLLIKKSIIPNPFKRG
jgi:LPXTG-motif cell wall-anchored protein